MTAARRVFSSARPLAQLSRILPMDPREQRVLEELRRRRVVAEKVR